MCEIGGNVLANTLNDTIFMCILACAGARKAPLLLALSFFPLGHCKCTERISYIEVDSMHQLSI